MIYVVELTTERTEAGFGYFETEVLEVDIDWFLCVAMWQLGASHGVYITMQYVSRSSIVSSLIPRLLCAAGNEAIGEGQK